MLMNNEKFIELSEEVIEDPYQTIMQWAEQRLLYTGAKVFSAVALQPVSLIMPDIKFLDSEIRKNIHILLLSASGTGKTTISKMLHNITYNPFSMESVTSAFLEEALHERADEELTLIVGDVARIFKDMVLVKTIEGVTGMEKRVSRGTARKVRDFDVNLCFFGAGLPESLTSCIKYGLIQRMTPIIIAHTNNEKEEIISKIVNNIGKPTKNLIDSQKIINYYKALKYIQDGKHEIKKIDGYVFPEEFRELINSAYSQIVSQKDYPRDAYQIREIHSAFRYLCAHTFLNLFNRKIEEDNGRRLIVPTEEDMRVAISLFDQEMTMKYQIFALDKMIASHSDIMSLYSKISRTTNPVVKKIAETLIKNRISNGNNR